MRRVVLVATMVVLFANVGQAQSLKELFSKENIEKAIDKVADKIVDFSIEGSWIFTGSAVKLGSESILASFGSGFASSSVEKAIDPYLAKVGITSGAMIFEFDEKGKFIAKSGKRSVKGTYEYNHKERILTLEIAKSAPIKANVEIGASTISILFNADALLKIIKSVTASSTNQDLVAVAKLLDSYEDMQIGFRFKREESKEE